MVSVSTKAVPDLTEQVVVAAASVTIWPVRGIRIASEHSESWGRMVSRKIRDTGIASNIPQLPEIVVDPSPEVAD